jgi:LmbE family N-acetylglucosaminyl deacetylase
VKLFISPHNDDETLFGSFLIQKHKPLVVVVFDSFIQVNRGADWCDRVTRRMETSAALNELLLNPAALFCGLRDDTEYTVSEIEASIAGVLMQETLKGQLADEIIAPAIEKFGHAHHNLVAMAAGGLAATLGVPLIQYTTYQRGTHGKTRTPNPVLIEDPMWIERKLNALACYRSQIRHPMCQPHFLRDLEEFTI